MKFCSRHQEDLTAMLRRKNLWRFVATDDKQMGVNLVAWLKGTTTKETFDPHIIAVLEIHKKAIEYCGPYVKGKNTAGQPYCPICESQKRLLLASLDQVWIDGITDLAYAIALANGYVTGADLRKDH